jgi:transposase-like protein
MTFVSVAQAARRLGIDAKTLHRWLSEAQLPRHAPSRRWSPKRGER